MLEIVMTIITSSRCWRRLESEPRRRCSGEPTVEPKARVLVRLPDRFERLTRMSVHNVEVAQFDVGANIPHVNQIFHNHPDRHLSSYQTPRPLLG